MAIDWNMYDRNASIANWGSSALYKQMGINPSWEAQVATFDNYLVNTGQQQNYLVPINSYNNSYDSSSNDSSYVAPTQPIGGDTLLTGPTPEIAPSTYDPAAPYTYDLTGDGYTSDQRRADELAAIDAMMQQGNQVQQNVSGFFGGGSTSGMTNTGGQQGSSFTQLPTYNAPQQQMSAATLQPSRLAALTPQDVGYVNVRQALKDKRRGLSASRQAGELGSNPLVEKRTLLG